MNDLQARRSPGQILRDALALYRLHWRTYALLAAAVVVPVYVVVFGIGLGQLTAELDTEASQGDALFAAAVNLLLVTPLVTAMVLAALREEQPSFRPAIQAGLDLFAPLLLVVVLVAVALAAGFMVLVVPGVFLAVRLAVAVQAVVLEDLRGMEALRRSWALTSGSFWRVLGVLALLLVTTFLVSAVAAVPFAIAAQAADAQVFSLLGAIAVEVLTAPFLAIAITLLFFDLRERAEPPPAAG